MKRKEVHCNFSERDVMAICSDNGRRVGVVTFPVTITFSVSWQHTSYYCTRTEWVPQALPVPFLIPNWHVYSGHYMSLGL